MGLGPNGLQPIGLHSNLSSSSRSQIVVRWLSEKLICMNKFLQIFQLQVGPIIKKEDTQGELFISGNQLMDGYLTKKKKLNYVMAKNNGYCKLNHTLAKKKIWYHKIS